MFIHEDFLLETSAARRLYHHYAASCPIADYHNHLPPREIAENRRFANLHDIWLEGDHYKWRAMRTNGVDERFCTGNASPREKFLAWARTMPLTLCNPLYHWSQLELKRYFDIDELLDESTAEAIWETSRQRLSDESLSVHGILRQFDVRVLCTTDDPVDDLQFHIAAAESELPTRVLPAFRPDMALRVDSPAEFNAWLERLGAIVDSDLNTLDRLLDALKSRHDFFHQHGCRLSDHGLERCYAVFPPEREVRATFDKARAGTPADPNECAGFTAHMMLHLAQWDAEKDWTKQLHLGALRNASHRSFAALGRDKGFDSIGDFAQAEALARFLSTCEREGGLPRLILYNNNPADNYVFATMAGNFQDGTVGGRVQFGSAWWFLDQRQGMEAQLRALANTSLLSRFVGMLTDSRSFMSFPRHEYFRRVLCNLLGGDMARGELPRDFDLVGEMIQRVCYQNTIDYLRLTA